VTLDGSAIQNAIYIAGECPWPTTAEAWENAAREKLDDGPFGYIAGGAGTEATMRANREAFEQRPLDRDQTMAQLERSFAHVKGALSGTAPARMSEKVTLFGQPASVQYTWVLTATHLHEHLGQLIAYARSNNVVPPWSK